MNVGEGSFGSLLSSCSLAFFSASFLRHRSTEAAAASSWNRSMMVVAVKSGDQLVLMPEAKQGLAYLEQPPHPDRDSPKP